VPDDVTGSTLRTSSVARITHLAGQVHAVESRAVQQLVQLAAQLVGFVRLQQQQQPRVGDESGGAEANMCKGAVSRTLVSMSKTETGIPCARRSP
jgi:hypothetical protein